MNKHFYFDQNATAVWRYLLQCGKCSIWLLFDLPFFLNTYLTLSLFLHEKHKTTSWKAYLPHWNESWQTMWYVSVMPIFCRYYIHILVWDNSKKTNSNTTCLIHHEIGGCLTLNDLIYHNKTPNPSLVAGNEGTVIQQASILTPTIVFKVWCPQSLWPKQWSHFNFISACP